MTNVKYLSYEARTSSKLNASSTVGPRKDQRVGYHVFAPVALGAFQNNFFSDVLWHPHCACSVPRCGLHINVCRQEGVQPECSRVGKSSMFFFSYSVVLINTQQSGGSAIHPHIGAPSGSMCKDQATWIPQSCQDFWFRGRPPY